ncbi:MAG: hypothetical protein JWN08_2606 [Frankiales bacterium]|jgi:hypothetical protein|nr:hypothetical protein [Frankiales bacterium]
MTEPSYDARDGSGDPETDPAAMGEVSAEHPDADGGAVVDASASPEGHPS